MTGMTILIPSSQRSAAFNASGQPGAAVVPLAS
jgi:hypothetical protein